MKSIKRINSTGSVSRVAALIGPSTRALSPRGIRVALLAAMVLVALAFWSTPTPADAGEPAEPVWSADMTVVEYTSVSIGAASADLFSNVGGSGNLQIKSLWSHIPDRDLRLAFDEDVPNASDYTLQVGGLSLEFPADSSGASSFKWNDVDVDWEDGQLIRVRIVPTAEIDAQQANTPATGVPTISGTAQVGETLAADTSGIADADGLTNVSYAYQWIRTDGGADADIAGATDSTYTLTDDDQGKTIKLKVTFNDDNGNSETLARVAAADVGESEQKPQFLVSNLGINVATGIMRPLNATRSGFAQAFTTGAKTGGYALGSVGIHVSHFYDGSTVGDHLQVTINGAASEGEPGDVHCTLTNPSSFSTPGVIAFEAPAGAGSCPQLATETAYFVVIEWVNPSGTDAFALIPQTYPTEETAATEEDPGGAEGWSIADESHYLTVSSDARTWTAYDETASFKIKVKEGAVTAAKANSPATGLPTISGTPQVEQTLTADTSAISDGDGLSNVSYQYQWLRDGADIAGQTNSTYRLVSADQDKTIQVRVTFRDDADNAESLTSMATTAVAARPTPAVLLTASFANVPADHNGSNFTFDLNFSENVNAGYARIRDDAFTISGGAIASASRITQGSNQGWTVEVDPTGNGAVSITLPETTDCDASGAICTDDSRKLSRSTSATVAGPPAISVSDATVQEAEGAVLVFTATLSHASSRTVTVDYATSDGTALAGSDYTAASGTLTFNAGDTSQTVQVTVLTDSEDESQETLTLTLSNPSQATLDDATGTGAIENGESSSGTQEDPPAEDPPAVLLTASFGNMPATHNGSAFTFDLTFSEESGISYVTLRNDAFSVTDGEVTSARRLTQGSNIGWTITVTPDSAADVTIVLPVTTDCDADGAVCTPDGRKLSNRLEFTVSGPSG